VRPILARLLVAAALAALGCATAAPPAPEPAPVEAPLAFEVESPAGARAVVFGSVHMARPDTWTLPETIRDAFAGARLLVLEVDLSTTTAEEMQALMLALGEMPPGQRLRQVVSDETWELLEDHAAGTGVPLVLLDRLKPWLLALQLGVLSMQQSGFDPQHGVELRVVEQAGDLPVRGLETPYEAFGVLDDLPYPVQDRMLLDALRPSDQQTSELDVLMEAWRRGDAARIEAIVFKDRSDPQLARFYEEFYERRNLRWAEALAEILAQTHPAFVVVGAGHLVGERSLQARLRESGFRIRQISGSRGPGR
jgi:uncharacterized protein YbaP (TraB family)